MLTRFRPVVYERSRSRVTTALLCLGRGRAHPFGWAPAEIGSEEVNARRRDGPTSSQRASKSAASVAVSPCNDIVSVGDKSVQPVLHLREYLLRRAFGLGALRFDP